jgi:hypothetical protein
LSSPFSFGVQICFASAGSNRSVTVAQSVSIENNLRGSRTDVVRQSTHAFSSFGAAGSAITHSQRQFNASAHCHSRAGTVRYRRQPWYAAQAIARSPEVSGEQLNLTSLLERFLVKNLASSAVFFVTGRFLCRCASSLRGTAVLFPLTMDSHAV